MKSPWAQVGPGHKWAPGPSGSWAQVCPGPKWTLDTFTHTRIAIPHQGAAQDTLGPRTYLGLE